MCGSTALSAGISHAAIYEPLGFRVTVRDDAAP
jgi:hypothetical protein